MPDPTTAHDPDRAGIFHASVLRRMEDLRAYEEAERVTERLTDTFAVLHALQALTEEVRQLRAAIEPSSSPLLTGTEAVREFKKLQESHHA